MMLLSRFWYAILAVALGAAIGLLYISIHHHNRIREADTRVIIEHDRDVVDWFLRLDARRRLDVLSIVSLDKEVRDDLAKSAGQEKISADVRDPLRKRLDALAQKYAALMKDEGRGGANPTALFAVDARGRVAAHVNYDRASQVRDESFELGGFPVVADAMHGFLRDDTWVFDREAMYRVVARPVVASEGGAPVGAVVSVRRVDQSFCKAIADRTQAPVMFYVVPPGGSPGGDDSRVSVAARAVPEKSDVSFDGVMPDAKALAADSAYRDSGFSSIMLDRQTTIAYTRVLGSGWDLGAGFAVARKVATVADVGALLSSSTEDDKRAIPWIFASGVGLAALLIGILATQWEHGLPMRKLEVEARKFAKGDQDALPVAKLSGGYRRVAQLVNDGIERVIAKGGGASRKAADLEQILGPVPSAPKMAAFSFNFGSAPAEPSARGESARGATSGAPTSGGGASGASELFPNLGAAPVRPVAAPAGAPTPSPAAVAPAVTPARTPEPAPSPPASPAPPSPTRQRMATPLPLTSRDVMPASQLGFDSASPAGKSDGPAASASQLEGNETPEEIAQWQTTFEAFVAMRAKCGESTAGLSFEKFQKQLRKNKEQLLRQFNARRVKFTVYEKEGKAALKATPIKE